MDANSAVSSLATENNSRLCYEAEPELLEKMYRATRYGNLRWYAIRTYSCREQVVAQSFRYQNICHYLPLLSEKRRWSDRIKTIQVPLFKNYLFVKIAPKQEAFWKVISTRGVTRILGDGRGPVPIADKEIGTIAHMLKNKAKLKITCSFQSGEIVRVKAGPLRGTEGSFVRIQGRDLLAVNIHILGQTVLTEVNYCDVEPY
jgi:transcription antitermination factor NusG